MAISWGSEISKGTSALKLGVEITALSTSDASLKLEAKYHVHTKYGVNDTVNTFKTSGTMGESSGSVSIKTSHSSGAGYDKSNRVLLKTVTKTITRTYGASQSVTAACSLTGIEAVGTSNTAKASTSYTVPARPYSKPATPTNVKHTRNSDIKNTVNWSRQATAAAPYTNVLVERSVNGGAYSQIASVAGTATSYVDTSTEANNYYRYRVRAKNSAGNSAYSAVTAITYNTPSAPSKPTVKLTTTPSVTVSWTDNSRTEDKFELQRRVNSGSWSLIASPTSTSYTDNSITPGVIEYRVRAVNTRGTTLYSAYSPTSDGLQVISAPTPPQQVVHTRNSDSQNTVSWVLASTALAPYTNILVERSVNGGAYSQVASLGASVTTYADTDTGVNKYFQYRVRATNAAGYSAYSPSTTTTYNTPSTSALNMLPTYLPLITTAPKNEDVADLGTMVDAVGLQAQSEFLVGASTSQGIYSWNGDNYRQITPSESDLGAAAITTMQNRVFIGGKESSPNIIEYTAVDDVADWANGGAIVLGAKGSGERILAFGNYRDLLIVATDRALHGVLVQGAETDWVVKTLSTQQGCAAPLSLVTAPNGVIFLGYDGVYHYGLVSGFGGDGEGVTELSGNITPTINAIKNKSIAAAVYFDSKYYLSIALDSDTQNTHTLVAGGGGESSTVWTLYNYGFTSFIRDGEKLYAGGYDGSIYQIETGYTDDEKPIKVEYETPQYANSPTLKDFREVTIIAHSKDNQDVSITMNTDGTEDEPEMLAFSQEENASQRIPFRRKGYAVGVKINATAYDQPLYITQVTIPFTERKR